jgi:hypothetical protein
MPDDPIFMGIIADYEYMVQLLVVFGPQLKSSHGEKENSDATLSDANTTDTHDENCLTRSVTCYEIGASAGLFSGSYWLELGRGWM